MNTIREYAGYFTFKELTDEDVDYLINIFRGESFEVDVSNEQLIFDSSGRDTDRLVIKIFKEVARVLREADGELRCEIDDEKNDPNFEFFSIKQGKLWLQRGRIVRGEDLLEI